MKKLLLSFGIGLSLFGSAQNSGGPDNFGYTWKSSAASGGPSFSWYDISIIGTQVNGLSDDNVVGPFPMSGFQYYTSSPTNFFIGSNGYISFTSVNIASSGGQFPAIPTAGGPNNFIAGLLSDLSFASSGNPGRAYHYDNGDSVCVSFVNVPFWINNAQQYGGSNTFQFILNKLDTSITINYLDQQGLPDATYTTNGLSMGIENATGADGLQQYRGMVFPLDSTSIKYYFPSVVAPITDGSVNWIGNDESKGDFILQGSSINLDVNIKNTGNQTINSFTANGTITPPATGTPWSSSRILTNLTPGDDTTFRYTTPYIPNALGIYSYSTTLGGISNDNTPSNNSLTQKLIALDPSLDTISMDYSDRITSGSIGWSGGNGGVAVYMKPPIYPAKIVTTDYYITALGTPAVGFHAMIYDDDGPNGTHGTLLDSVYVAPGTITIGSYTSVPPNDTNLTINDGGVYIHWLMDGDGINIGSDNTPPISKRAIEVILGGWADYRDRETQDFMMGMTIATPSEDGEVTSIGQSNGKGIMLQRNTNYPLTSTISNIGFRNASNVMVVNQLETHTGTVISVGNGSATLPQLNAGTDTTFTFANNFTPSILGTYSYQVYLDKLLKDSENKNDTMQQEVMVVDSNSALINVSYANSTAEGSLVNSATMGGYAVYFEPSFYPARVKKMSFYHTNLGNSFGFTAKIVRADSSLTILDSVLIGSGTLTANAYADVIPTNNNILINSGGIYIVWEKFGNGIELGYDGEIPFSKQNFQIGNNGLEPYINNSTEDIMIKAEFERGSIPVGVNEYKLESLQTYPNPFNNYTTIKLPTNIDGNTALIQIRDIKGQLVNAKVIKFQNELRLFKGALSPGQYTYSIQSEGRLKALGKLTIL